MSSTNRRYNRPIHGTESNQHCRGHLLDVKGKKELNFLSAAAKKTLSLSGLNYLPKTAMKIQHKNNKFKEEGSSCT